MMTKCRKNDNISKILPNVENITNMSKIRQNDKVAESVLKAKVMTKCRNYDKMLKILQNDEHMKNI